MRFFMMLIFFMASLSAQAKPSQGRLGVGLMLGEPSGLSFKLFVDRRHAFDAGLSYSILDHAVHVHADYLLHFPGQIKPLEQLKGGQWIPYAGIGGKLRVFDRDGNNASNGLSVRLPLGVTFHPRGLPLDFFIELVPGMRVLPETEAEIGGAIGGRFYF